MTDRPAVPKEDRAALYGSVTFAVVGIALTLASLVGRFVELASSSDPQVEIYAAGQDAALAVGPDGSAVEASVDTASIAVHAPEAKLLALMYLQAAWSPLFVCAALVIAAIVFLRVTRGQVFERRTVRLVTWAAGVVAVGWLGEIALTTMVTNFVLGDLSQGANLTFSTVIATGPLMWVLVLGAVAGALQLGERLQRDTEGLV